MLWILMMFVWAAMLVSPIVMLFVFLPSGRECPRCAGETLPIRSRLLRPMRSIVSKRWCFACDWEGVSRNVILRRKLPRFEVVPHDGGDDRQPWQKPS